MELALELSGNAGHLAIAGDMTLARAGELKEVLLRAIKDVNRLTINLEEMTGADLSFLQLICAAYTSFNKENKELTISGKESTVVGRLLKDTGYSRHAVWALNDKQKCIWTGGVG